MELNFNSLSKVRNPKLKKALKYEKLGYLWKFKNILLSGNFTDREISFALKEYRNDIKGFLK
jgi:hypothetical protein